VGTSEILCQNRIQIFERIVRTFEIVEEFQSVLLDNGERQIFIHQASKLVGVGVGVVVGHLRVLLLKEWFRGIFI
jgi:hypothetical protein